MGRTYLRFLLVGLCIFALGMAGCANRTKSTAPETGSTPALANAGAGTAAAATAPDRTGWPVIVAFGDSLTQGQGVSATQNYPSRLQAMLDQAGYRYRVVNAGISGDTTSGGLARVDRIIGQKPAIVILELGANDGLRGESIEQMRSNLAHLIEQLHAAHIQVVLAGMQIPPNYGSGYTQAFTETFLDLADTYHVALIPFLLEGVGGRPDLNQPDGIHPTGDGYRFVVNNVMQALEPLLSKP